MNIIYLLGAFPPQTVPVGDLQRHRFFPKPAAVQLPATEADPELVPPIQLAAESARESEQPMSAESEVLTQGQVHHLLRARLEEVRVPGEEQTSEQEKQIV